MSTPICPICFSDSTTLEGLQSLSTCGHVFHELCLQQWLEYCPVSKAPTCPVCKQKYARSDIHKLYFQSTSEPAKSQSASQSEDDGELKYPDKKTLVNQLAVVQEALQECREQTNELVTKLLGCERRLETAEKARKEAERDVKRMTATVVGAHEECRRVRAENDEMKVKVEKMEKQARAVKVLEEVDMNQEDIVQMYRGKNKEELIDTLMKSLMIRNKTYKELLTKCVGFGAAEARASEKEAKALKEVAKLQAKLAAVEAAMEAHQLEKLRQQAVKGKAKAANTCSRATNTPTPKSKDHAPVVGAATVSRVHNEGAGASAFGNSEACASNDRSRVHRAGSEFPREENVRVKRSQRDVESSMAQRRLEERGYSCSLYDEANWREEHHVDHSKSAARGGEPTTARTSAAQESQRCPSFAESTAGYVERPRYFQEGGRDERRVRGDDVDDSARISARGGAEEKEGVKTNAAGGRTQSDWERSGGSKGAVDRNQRASDDPLDELLGVMEEEELLENDEAGCEGERDVVEETHKKENVTVHANGHRLGDAEARVRGYGAAAAAESAIGDLRIKQGTSLSRQEASGDGGGFGGADGACHVSAAGGTKGPSFSATVRASAVRKTQSGSGAGMAGQVLVGGIGAMSRKGMKTVPISFLGGKGGVVGAAVLRRSPFGTLGGNSLGSIGVGERVGIAVGERRAGTAEKRQVHSEESLKSREPTLIPEPSAVAAGVEGHRREELERVTTEVAGREAVPEETVSGAPLAVSVDVAHLPPASGSNSLCLSGSNNARRPPLSRLPPGKRAKVQSSSGAGDSSRGMTLQMEHFFSRSSKC